MQNWRQISHDAKDILTVCLAKAIDQALTARLGNCWFAEFAQADAKEKVNTRISKPGQRSVQDMDLQALLKFLRYRSAMTIQVLEYYHFFASMDTLAAEDQMRQLNALLDRLVNDFRNRIEAHSRASDIEKELSGESLSRIYGYEEAYQDMYKLTRIFGSVTDHNGIAYCRQMAKLTEPQPKKWIPILAGSIALALIAGLLLLLLIGNSSDPHPSTQTTTAQSSPVQLQPVKLSYDGDTLVAVCQITNHTSKTISNITVDSFCLTDGDQKIAAADFGLLQEATLAPEASLYWQFRFPAESISTYDADLSGIDFSVVIQYE